MMKSWVHCWNNQHWMKYWMSLSSGRHKSVVSITSLWNELRDTQVKERWSWFKSSELNDLNWKLRVSWGSVARTQEHKPALAEQQLCPQLLFLFSAFTPTLVSGKPAPVSLVAQSMVLIQRQTSIKREHYSAVTAMPSSAFPIPWCRPRTHARQAGTCIVQRMRHCWGLRFSPWTVNQRFVHCSTTGQNWTLVDLVCIPMYNL